MTKISHWTARRSGSTMTVKGRGPDGLLQQVTGVYAIAARNGQIEAHCKGGPTVILTLPTDDELSAALWTAQMAGQGC